MSIETDQKGEVLYYIQRVNGKQIKIMPENMIHFNMNTLGTEVFGISAIVPLKRVISSKRLTEEYTNRFFIKNATPKVIYNVPDEWNQERKKLFGKQLAGLKPHSDIIVSDKVEAKVIGSPMTDMLFKEWLTYRREEILVAMGLFPILLGLPEGSNKSNSQVQFASFRLGVKAKQNALVNLINTRLLPALFGSSDLAYRYTGLSLEEYKLRADITHQLSRAYGNLVKQLILTPEEAKTRFDKMVDNYDKELGENYGD